MLVRLFILILVAAGLVAGGYHAINELYYKPQKKLQADKDMPAPLPPPDPSIAEFDKCMETRRSGNLPEARSALERFLKEFPESRKRPDALNAIGEINSQEFFAMKPTVDNTYVVQSGDSLSRVSARRRLPVELLLRLNQLDSENLQIGQRLIAPQADFRVTLDQKKRMVVLTNGAKFFRQYPAIVWPGMHKKPVVFLPKATGKINDKVALNEKGNVKPTDKDYAAADHIIGFTIPAHALYTHHEDPKKPVNRPVGGGIGLAPEHMSEIAILLPRGTPVTLD